MSCFFLDGLDRIIFGGRYLNYRETFHVGELSDALLFLPVQRMRTERDSLKETIEELHCVQAQEGQLTSGTVPDRQNPPGHLTLL